ncbi:SRPBCC family protein [Streptomyces sp. NPDC020379]|uniref:SRPBCC family protein n=1 Tax=Streptomyces sp. NPDC020379 TaxID=3365071 RepID=UPI0037B86ECD
MARRLRPVGLDFVEAAPLRLVFVAHMAAAPRRVYAALAEDVPGWARWFRAVTAARPVERAAVKGREIRLLGGARFLETVLAEDPSRRYAYRVDVTNAPGVRAMAEDWQLLAVGTGTVVRWTVAVDGSAPVRLAAALARPGLGYAFRDAVHCLDRRLTAMHGRPS